MPAVVRGVKKKSQYFFYWSVQLLLSSVGFGVWYTRPTVLTMPLVPRISSNPPLTTAACSDASGSWATSGA